MKRRWAFVNELGDGKTYGEHGLREHPMMLLIVWINNRIARSPKWGYRFEVRMERVK